MKRIDRFKLGFTRNWHLPGRERFSAWLSSSKELKKNLKDGIVWPNNEDIAIYTTADNFIEWAILSTGTYEDEINKLIKISLKPGDTALDIGANIGLQSLRMAKSVGSGGKVYAFEPLEYLQEKLGKNIALNSAENITVFPYALADKEHTAVLKIDKNSWNQGSFSLGNNTGNETQEIQIRIADQIAEIKELENLKLIKIDVEGFEYQVLKGLRETLMKHKPRIIFECDLSYWDKTGQDIRECYHFLTSLNYTIYQVNIVGCELIAGPDQIQSGNLFCLNGGDTK